MLLARLHTNFALHHTYLSFVCVYFCIQTCDKDNSSFQFYVECKSVGLAEAESSKLLNVNIYFCAALCDLLRMLYLGE